MSLRPSVLDPLFAPVTVLRHAALNPEYDRRLQDLAEMMKAAGVTHVFVSDTKPIVIKCLR